MIDSLNLSEPIDEAAVRRYRLDTVRSIAADNDVAAVLLFQTMIRSTSAMQTVRGTCRSGPCTISVDMR